MDDPQQQQQQQPTGGAGVAAPVDSPKKRVEELLDEVLAQPYRKRQATEANSVNGGANTGNKSVSGAVDLDIIINQLF